MTNVATPLTVQEHSNREWALIQSLREETVEIVRSMDHSKAERLARLWREIDEKERLYYGNGTDGLFSYEERLAQAKQLLNEAS